MPLRVGDALVDSKLGEQISLEIDAIQMGVQRYRKLCDEAVARGEAGSLKPVERLIVSWFPWLVNRIKHEQEEILAGNAGNGRAIGGPVVCSLDVDRLAVITLNTMLGRCVQEPAGDLFMKMAYAVGNAVIAEIHHDMIRDHDRRDMEALDSRFRRITPARVNHWAKNSLDDHLWNRKACVTTGSILINCAVEICTLPAEVDDEVVMQKSFIHERQWRDKKQKGCIRLSDATFRAIEDGHMFRQHLRPRFMPMLVPPYEWCDELRGGYVNVKTPLISKPTSDQMAALEESNTEVLYQSLNAINSTAWKVNDFVLDVMSKLWDQGGGFAGIPRADLFPMPPKPIDIETNEESLKRWKQEAHDVHGKNASIRGQRIEFVQKISMAQRMLEKDEFYFPHQMCFRFRYYPIPVWLNHHGNDSSRGLLHFAKQVELTDKGRRWLLIHAANMWGYDKADFDGRIQYVKDMASQIKMTAKDPMSMVEWWSQADKPFQFLAACKALCDDRYGSRLAVHIDGSCNGTQHYCAAARDAEGGKWVNLIPSDSPQDAYEEVRRVAQLNIEADSNPMSDEVLPYLSRSVIKQPVMTSNYNVTRIGAKDQVKQKLKDAEFPNERLKPCSMYLANVTLDSLGDVFTGPQQLMRWIEESTKSICKVYPSVGLKWKTPMGVVAVQPYRQTKRVEVKTVMQRVILGHRREDLPVSKGKQRQGGPPNIVHSWDGAHEGMVAIICFDEQIDFAGIHDAYLAHAENMDRVVEITKEQFIEMHDQDQIGEIYKFWKFNYPLADIEPPPPKGKLDLQEIMNSDYFFS